MFTSHTSTSTTAQSTGDWAREVVTPDGDTRRPEAAADPRNPARSRGALVLYATAMVAGPLAMTAWFLTEPAILPREAPTEFLASVAASPDRYLVATLLMGLAATLAVPAALGIGALLRPRLPRLGAIITTLLFLSGIGLAAQVGFRVFVWSMVKSGSVPSWAPPSFAAFQDGGAFDYLLAPGLVFGGVGTLLLVGALLATRIVRWWVPVALVAGMVLASGEFPDAVTVLGAALGAVANARLAVRLLRG